MANDNANRTALPRRSGKNAKYVCEDLGFNASEAFKTLRTNVIMACPQENEACRLMGVTGPMADSGISTIAVNLAYSVAELGKRVLLIDADMRRPSIHEKTGVPGSPGLSELLGKTASAEAAMHKYTDKMGKTSFDILSAGAAVQNPSELLSSDGMSCLLRKLSGDYDYIILDLPPVGAVVDAVAASTALDGMLVVIRENTCERSLLAQCMSQLEYANVNVIGFVVNGALERSGK